jgi:hypothetical protein
MPAYGAVPRLKCGVDYPPATYTVMICNVRLTSKPVKLIGFCP